MDNETLKDRIQAQEDGQRAKDLQSRRDLNSDLFPRETSPLGRSKPSDYHDKAPTPSSVGDDRGFSVLMNTKTASKPFEKIASGASTATGGMRTSRSTAELRHPIPESNRARGSAFYEEMNPDNYLKLYERRQRELAAQKQQDAARERKQREAQGRKQENAETALRVRARELFDEIQYWRGQYAMGVHDPSYINAMISNLQTEMNGIDPRYWP